MSNRSQLASNVQNGVWEPFLFESGAYLAVTGESICGEILVCLRAERYHWSGPWTNGGRFVVSMPEKSVWNHIVFEIGPFFVRKEQMEISNVDVRIWREEEEEVEKSRKCGSLRFLCYRRGYEKKSKGEKERRTL